MSVQTSLTLRERLAIYIGNLGHAIHDICYAVLGETTHYAETAASLTIREADLRLLNRKYNEIKQIADQLPASTVANQALSSRLIAAETELITLRSQLEARVKIVSHEMNESVAALETSQRITITEWRVQAIKAEAKAKELAQTLAHVESAFRKSQTMTHFRHGQEVRELQLKILRLEDEIRHLRKLPTNGDLVAPPIPHGKGPFDGSDTDLDFALEGSEREALLRTASTVGLAGS